MKDPVSEIRDPNLYQGNKWVMGNVELYCVACAGKPLMVECVLILHRDSNGVISFAGESLCLKHWGARDALGGPK